MGYSSYEIYPKVSIIEETVLELVTSLYHCGCPKCIAEAII